MAFKQKDSEPLYHRKCLIYRNLEVGGIPKFRDATSSWNRLAISSCLDTLVLYNCSNSGADPSFGVLSKKTGKQPAVACVSACICLPWISGTGNIPCAFSTSFPTGVGALSGNLFRLQCLTEFSGLIAWCSLNCWLCGMDRWRPAQQTPPQTDQVELSFWLAAIPGWDPFSSQAPRKS